MDDISRIYALLSAQKFLLIQLYGKEFLAEPDARKNVPGALIDAATYKSHTKDVWSDGEALIEMQAQVVIELKDFFSDVERRVKEVLAQGRQ